MDCSSRLVSPEETPGRGTVSFIQGVFGMASIELAWQYAWLRRAAGLLTLAVVLGLSPAGHAQTEDRAATMLLESARRAYNEKNYPFATDRFKEYLTRFGSTREAPSARYGLALCLIEGPQRNFQGAVENLQAIAGNKELPDHPYVLYYLAHAQRGLALDALALATAKPQEANQHRQTANQRFEEASRNFAAAVTAFTARVPAPKPDIPELPTELEWAARARCDQAEMLVRLLKSKEAQATVAPFLTDDLLVKSRYRRLALYYHGFASFLLKDNLTAGKSLNQLTPFADPVFGTHARYLLARVHHLDGERTEAAQHYDGVITQHAKEVLAAREALKNPQVFQNNPTEKARLQALANGPLPDHIARANLYLGVMQYENGKFADALARFAEFRKTFPDSPLALEVQLRQGFCQVQLRQWKDAIQTLQPLADKQPQLADQALFWIAKAHIGAADPANPKVYQDTLKVGIDTFRKAIEKARGETPELKARRGQMLFELAEAQLLAQLPRDGATTCTQLLNEKLLPEREEEITQRLADAYHLAADYNESDRICQQFRDRFPRSPLLANVTFRFAENAYFRALAAEKNKVAPAEQTKLQDETIKRYQVVVEKFPDFPQISVARYGLAMGYYRKGDIDKSREVLEAIPAADRTGELATVPYVLADCLMRLAPENADDAVAAGKLLEQLTKATELLSGFVAAQPKGPMAADSLLKVGFCQQRLADLLAQPPEKAKAIQEARKAYEQLMRDFPNHPLFAQAVLERARVMAQANDVGGAMNELQRFTRDPLKNSPVAPLAALRLATLMRAQNRAADAIKVMETARKDHEANLARDPARAAWVPLLMYHHGVALQDAEKRTEAKQVFDQIVQQHSGKPEAVEAALRSGQCLKDEGRVKIDTARKILDQPQGKPADQLAKATQQRDEGMKNLRDAVQYLEDRANQLKDKPAATATRARMLYDAAWASRALAEVEVETAQRKLEQERWQKLKEDLARKTPPGKQPPPVARPHVALSEVPLQPAEEKSRKLYLAAIEAAPELAQSADTRFELAELYSERNEHDAAIKLLKEALDQEPPAELTERIQLRLGVCLAAKGATDEALKRFEPIARNAKSPLQAQATYRVGECYLQLKKYDEAEKRLKMFRDHGPFQNLAGLTDRALLRLGHVYRELKQWDASRQALEQVVNRFGQSPWIHEARYGIGWAHQQKGELDQAVNVYNQVTAGTATELGARAQLNIGLCRMAQKRYPEAATALLVVPFTYDYPELSATALLEAARALAENKQKDKAIPLLERLLRDHPESEQAEVAKKRLELLKQS